MPLYRVYGILYANTLSAEVEAEDAEAAIEKYCMMDESCPILCYHCAGTVEIGDIFDFEVEEI